MQSDSNTVQSNTDTLIYIANQINADYWASETDKAGLESEIETGSWSMSSVAVGLPSNRRTFISI